MPLTRIEKGFRAKFRVTEVCLYADIPGRDVTLAPVYSGITNSEDKIYWESHPSGEITIHVKDEDVAVVFSPGTEFYIDFLRAS